MTDQDAFNLIFAAGFSTAEKVTNVSGRGVGMDVVRTNIQKLKGTVHIDSRLGQGSVFTIKMPLTLAIIQGLLVRVSEEIYALPLSSVIEVVSTVDNKISTVQMAEVIRIRDQVYPLLRLENVLSIPSMEDEERGQYVVLIGLAEQRIGIVVDELLGQKEIVVKSLGDYLEDVPGIAGSTILGDGRVIMIIDIAEIFNSMGKPGRRVLAHSTVG
jgi:two-component system chemotaxis sensor kinase CheA